LGEEVRVKKFKLRYVVECELTVEDLWPDGDAPESPSNLHVRELIRRDGGILNVLNEWNLHQTSSVWDVWGVE
jgi:hypothetical protein